MDILPNEKDVTGKAAERQGKTGQQEEARPQKRQKQAHPKDQPCQSGKVTHQESLFHREAQAVPTSLMEL
jgi:hypothetical protein